MASKSRFWRAVEWLARIHAVHVIITSEFFRTLLLPTALTVLTGGAGIFAGVPLMWVVMASALTFGGAMTGLVRGSEYVDKKNPNNKLIFLGTFAALTLNETPVPLVGTRKARRASRSTIPKQTLGPNDLMAGVRREVEQIQIAVEVTNKATFPISVVLQSADTEVEGEKPPRAQFPKQPTLLLPGNTIRISDDPVDLDGQQAGQMAGKMDFLIKYGLPGKEYFEMKLKADLLIQMTDFGLVTMIHSNWVK